MSLSLMKERLQQGYYRQLEGWLGDVATLESNARAFCGDDSPVTEAAAGGTHPLPLCNIPLDRHCYTLAASAQSPSDRAS